MIYDLNYMIDYLGLNSEYLDKNLKKYDSYLAFNEKDLKEDGLSDETIKKIENNYLDGYIRYQITMCSIGEQYLNKIFQEGFVVSIEDIAILFDVSIRYATTEIAPLLRRLVFPETKFHIKEKMKNDVGKYIVSRKNELAEYYFLFNKYSDNHMRITNDEGIKGIMRKKVLFNIYDLIEYCKDNVITESSFIPIYINRYIVDTNTLSEKWNYNNNLSFQNMVKDSFDKFINFKIKENNYKHIEMNFDFEIFLKSLILTRNFKGCDFTMKITPMKSMASLRILFEKVYNTEILRMMDSKAMRVLSLRIGKEKKYMRRYILGRDDIKKQFETEICVSNHIDSYKLKIQEDVFINLFNSNEVDLTIEFNKFIETMATH